MKAPYFIFVLFLFIALSPESQARTITATSSGAWESSTTWGGATVACGDTVNIPAGRTVQITSVLDYSACGTDIVVNVTGTLNFQNGKKLRLSCGSLVIVNTGGWITSGGGGGNSNLIDICNTIVWNTAMGNLQGPVTLQVNPLPVSLAYFTASAEKDFVSLNWITYSEINNDCFLVEKSSDGKNYLLIGRITGAGTTSNPQTYFFKDTDPQKGLQFYRLTQRDFDGKMKTFKPVAVRWENELVLSFYPNPGKGELFATVPNSFARQTVRLVLQDMNSGVVLQKDISFGDKINGVLLLSKSELLKPGNYIATLILGDQKFARTIVVQ